MTRMDYGNGDYEQYSYDIYGRKVHTKVKTDNDSNDYQDFTMEYDYRYNGDGQLYEMVDENYGKTYRYNYDTLGRLIGSEELHNDIPALQTWHRYDSYDRLKTQSWKLLDKSFEEAYTYDDYGRLTEKDITPLNEETSSILINYTDSLSRVSSVNTPVSNDFYNYLSGSDTDSTTGLVSAYSHNPRNGNHLDAFGYKYLYDALGNITQVESKVGTIVVRTEDYTYDCQNQLLSATMSEDGGNAVASWEQTYDTYGNIRSKVHTPFVGSSTTYQYSYGNTNWRDLLTSIQVTKNGTSTTHSYTYDAIGNPKSYYNLNNEAQWTMGWINGRSLRKATCSGTTVTYAYDSNALRTQKAVNGVTHTYNYAGGLLLRESYTQGTVNYILDFVYDQNNRPFMLYLTQGNTTTPYYYLLNLQGDVAKLVDANGSTVAEYTYDPWGGIVSAIGTKASINPLRYRGYYYDTETGFYYLQSRYYDPEIGRFINADRPELSALSASDLTSTNLFEYCANDPICSYDPTGEIFLTLLSGGINAVVSAAFAFFSGEDMGKALKDGLYTGLISGAGVEIGLAAASLCCTGVGLLVVGVSGAVAGVVSTGLKNNWGGDYLEYIMNGAWGGLFNLLSYGFSVPASGKFAKDTILNFFQMLDNLVIEDFWDNLITGTILAGGNAVASMGIEACVNALRDRGYSTTTITGYV